MDENQLPESTQQVLSRGSMADNTVSISDADIDTKLDSNAKDVADILPPELTKTYALFKELLEFDDQFPREVLMLPGERPLHYNYFLVYLLQDPAKRSIADVARIIFGSRVGKIRTDSRQDPNKPWQSPTYTKLVVTAKSYDWKRRAQAWDDYNRKRMLGRIAYIQQTAPLKAWKLLDDFVSNATVKPELRLKAANDILDRSGFPRTTASISDSTVRSIKDIDAKTLKQMLIDYLEARRGDVHPVPTLTVDVAQKLLQDMSTQNQNTLSMLTSGPVPTGESEAAQHPAEIPAEIPAQNAPVNAPEGLQGPPNGQKVS